MVASAHPIVVGGSVVGLVVGVGGCVVKLAGLRVLASALGVEGCCCLTVENLEHLLRKNSKIMHGGIQGAEGNPSPSYSADAVNIVPTALVRGGGAPANSPEQRGRQREGKKAGARRGARKRERGEEDVADRYRCGVCVAPARRWGAGCRASVGSAPCFGMMLVSCAESI